MSGDAKLRFLFGMLPADTGTWLVSDKQTCPGCGRYMGQHPEIDNIFACRNTSCLSVYANYANDFERLNMLNSIFESYQKEQECSETATVFPAIYLMAM